MAKGPLAQLMFVGMFTPDHCHLIKALKSANEQAVCWLIATFMGL